jgi:hypothetical protein
MGIADGTGRRGGCPRVLLTQIIEPESKLDILLEPAQVIVAALG